MKIFYKPRSKFKRAPLCLMNPNTWKTIDSRKEFSRFLKVTCQSSTSLVAIKSKLMVATRRIIKGCCEWLAKRDLKPILPRKTISTRFFRIRMSFSKSFIRRAKWCKRKIAFRCID